MRKRRVTQSIDKDALQVSEQKDVLQTDVDMGVNQPEEIAEALVFKLAYLEERKAHLANLAMLRMKVFDERMQQLKYERRVELEKIEHEQLRISESLKALQAELEAKHNIKLSEYAYNDETGCLVRLPKDSLQEVKENGSA